MTGYRHPAAVTASGAVALGPGVFLPAEVCGPIWRVLRSWAAGHRDSGGVVSPVMESALDSLRAAAQGHDATAVAGHRPTTSRSAISANGDVSGSPAEMDPTSSVPALLTTEQVADRLHCGPRHARHLAREAGIAPHSRDAWHTTDIDRLVATRRRTHP